MSHFIPRNDYVAMFHEQRRKPKKNAGSQDRVAPVETPLVPKQVTEDKKKGMSTAAKAGITLGALALGSAGVSAYAAKKLVDELQKKYGKPSRPKPKVERNLDQEALDAQWEAYKIERDGREAIRERQAPAMKELSRDDYNLTDADYAEADYADPDLENALEGWRMRDAERQQERETQAVAEIDEYGGEDPYGDGNELEVTDPQETKDEIEAIDEYGGDDFEDAMGKDPNDPYDDGNPFEDAYNYDDYGGEDTFEDAFDYDTTDIAYEQPEMGDMFSDAVESFGEGRRRRLRARPIPIPRKR